MDFNHDNIAVGFLGAGKMAQALAKGFISAGESGINVLKWAIMNNFIHSVPTFRVTWSNMIFDTPSRFWLWKPKLLLFLLMDVLIIWDIF